MDGEGKKYKSDFIRKNMKSRYEKMTHTAQQFEIDSYYTNTNSSKMEGKKGG